VKHCRPDVFFTTVSYAIKGTPYFDKVASRLVNIRPWEVTTDREIQVRGRHSRDFYRHADELLKREMDTEPDAGKILAARQALRAASHEVEM
jgi:anaerobic magnesium-protoporphyrin IX monomethyl ester cyclase